MPNGSGACQQDHSYRCYFISVSTTVSLGQFASFSVPCSVLCGAAVICTDVSVRANNLKPLPKHPVLASHQLCRDGVCFETLLIHSTLSFIQFKAQWLDKDILKSMCFLFLLLESTSSLMLQCITWTYNDRTDTISFQCLLLYGDKGDNIITFVWHNVAPSQLWWSKTRKQANWHSPETQSYRIHRVCLKTVKIFSLKLCNAKVSNGVQYVTLRGNLKMKPDRVC